MKFLKIFFGPILATGVSALFLYFAGVSAGVFTQERLPIAMPFEVRVVYWLFLIVSLCFIVVALGLLASKVRLYYADRVGSQYDLPFNRTYVTVQEIQVGTRMVVVLRSPRLGKDDEPFMYAYTDARPLWPIFSRSMSGTFNEMSEEQVNNLYGAPTSEKVVSILTH